MAVNSREKGRRGEVEFAKSLRELGFADARRGQQYSGANGDADVVGVPGVHWEIKRVERGLNLVDALKQAERDARPGELPHVAHRRNREPWQVTMSLETWLELYRKAGLNGDLQKCPNEFLD